MGGSVVKDAGQLFEALTRTLRRTSLKHISIFILICQIAHNALKNNTEVKLIDADILNRFSLSLSDLIAGIDESLDSTHLDFITIGSAVVHLIKPLLAV